MITFTKQEFQSLQGLFNDMYQSSTLRDGPMGEMVISIRNKFLVFGPVDLTDSEQRFALFTVNDVFVTSHSPLVQPQLGNAVRVLGSDERRVVSSISELNKPQESELSGSYATAWEIMQSIMKKLGQVPPPAYVPLAAGPTGDPYGISDRNAINMDNRTTDFRP